MVFFKKKDIMEYFLSHPNANLWCFFRLYIIRRGTGSYTQYPSGHKEVLTILYMHTYMHAFIHIETDTQIAICDKEDIKQ